MANTLHCSKCGKSRRTKNEMESTLTDEELEALTEMVLERMHAALDHADTNEREVEHGNS